MTAPGGAFKGWLGIAGVVVTLSAVCGIQHGELETAPWLPRYEVHGSGTDLAVAFGQIHREGNCLYLVSSSMPSYRTVPLFPDTARYVEGAEMLIIDGRGFHPGEEVAFVGGDAGDSLGFLSVQPDQSCDVSHAFVASGLARLP